jgi:hypothetical protein
MSTRSGASLWAINKVTSAVPVSDGRVTQQCMCPASTQYWSVLRLYLCSVPKTPGLDDNVAERRDYHRPSLTGYGFEQKVLHRGSGVVDWDARSRRADAWLTVHHSLTAELPQGSRTP